MNIEIERKFLLKDDSWKGENIGVHYAQCYLNKGNCTIRARVAGDKGFLTIKGKTESFSREEFEYEIPAEDARGLFKFSLSSIVEKIRYRVPYKGHTWEIDEFLGANKGLVVAEIELESEDEEFEMPEWLGREVTGEKRYYNSHLAEKPYGCW